ncbi:putative ribonuclease H-like domain-containing protein [Tanacetum coccineum]
MMALTGVEQDDWSIEFDAEHMHFGQDGLDDFDWSNKADDAPVSLALMATNSEGQSRRRSQDYAIIDSGCSGCKTRDKDKLSDFKEFKGVVAFGNDSKVIEQPMARSTDKAKITRKRSKTEQTRTRERKSTQKAERKLSKSNPSQPSVNLVNKKEPKKVSQALADESWVEAMQEELLQFKLQEVWVLCDLPEGKRVIGTKWVFRNKRDERGTIIKNKARLVAQVVSELVKRL